MLYRGQKEALSEFLPLNNENWIVQGNALRLDWLTVCEPTGRGGGKIFADDLYGAPLDQGKIDFENEGGETYICGNPPYLGSTWQEKEQKADLERIFGHLTNTWKSLDYVAGWFMKAVEYAKRTPTVSAFVSTNSICQGQQVPILWPLIFKAGHEIAFAHTSFKWANLASHNAGVTVVIVGISNHAPKERSLYSLDENGETVLKQAENINAYLAAADSVIVEKRAKPANGLPEMSFGSKPVDGGHLLMSRTEADALSLSKDQRARYIRRIYGSAEFIRGLERYCLWIRDAHLTESLDIPAIARRVEGVRKMRLASTKLPTVESARWAHLFGETRQTGSEIVTIIPSVSSENRDYLPVGYKPQGTIVTNACSALYDAPLWCLSIIASRIHLVWIASVCGKLKTDFRYSNTLGWNTFPLPKLTEQNKADLTRCAENILLAREAHYPATIADLYEPETMPPDLRRAHDENDETLERIYIGRRFRNDTERLEKLFDLYTKMTNKGKAA